jgi:GH3 auxin-responsive promoter
MATKSMFNSVINWFIKKRIDQIEYFIKYPIETQNGVLFSQLFMAEATVYGQKYRFKDIRNYHDFTQQVPVVRYEEIEPYIHRAQLGEKDVLWPGYTKQFAKSSGTTNAKSKFIPISEASLLDCHYKAGKDLVAIYVNNHPESKLFERKNLRLGGSFQLQGLDSKAGDLSAILIENLPLWVEIINTPSRKVSLMDEWESKLKAMVNEIKHEDVGSLTGVPSWMMVLLQKLQAETKVDHIAQLWPNLEAFFHGGISFLPYQEQYKNMMGKPINYYEIYNASEGFFAIQDRHGADDMLLMLDYGVFYEFINIEDAHLPHPPTFTLDQVEIGRNYAMVITTNGGLWRYLIGDTVRFTSLSPYRIKISGRTKQYINAFGEELMVENVEMALKKVCANTQSQIKEYSGAPIFMSQNQKGAHEWMFEFSQLPQDMAEFAQKFDQELKNLNSDYEAKRYKNFTLSPPKIHVAQPDLFYHWMKARGKLGGQHKVPRLCNDRQYIDQLLLLNQSRISDAN